MTLLTTPAGVQFDTADEEWRDMVGAPWEGKFEISNMGRRRYRPDYDGPRSKKPISEWGSATTSGHRSFETKTGGRAIPLLRSPSRMGSVQWSHRGRRCH